METTSVWKLVWFSFLPFYHLHHFQYQKDFTSFSKRNPKATHPRLIMLAHWCKMQKISFAILCQLNQQTSWSVWSQIYKELPEEQKVTIVFSAFLPTCCCSCVQFPWEQTEKPSYSSCSSSTQTPLQRQEAVMSCLSLWFSVYSWKYMLPKYPPSFTRMT